MISLIYISVYAAVANLIIFGTLLSRVIGDNNE